MELHVLYQLLVKGGVLIIDNYGYWQGVKKAVDEYFKDHRIYLQRTSPQVRTAVKTF